MRHYKELVPSEKDSERYRAFFLYREDQSGDKSCKQCRFYKKRLPKELIARINENMPEEYKSKEFGICSIADMISKKEEKRSWVITFSDSLCNLFNEKLSKKIKMAIQGGRV